MTYDFHNCGTYDSANSYSVVECSSKSTTKKCVDSRLASSFGEVRKSWTNYLVVKMYYKLRERLIIYSLFTYVRPLAKTKGVCWRMYSKAQERIICEYIVR